MSRTRFRRFGAAPGRRLPELRPGRLAAAGALVLLAGFLAGATECTYRGKPVGGGSSSRDQLTQGTITGFGSIVVGGVTYSTSGLAITLDGATASESALRPGMVVALRGRLDADRTTGRADRLTADAALVGTVEARDASAATIRVLNTPVQLANDTSYGAGLDGAATTPFAIGDRVVVHGYSGVNTAVLATRVERAADTRDLQAAGRVSALDSTARRFSLRGTVVDYSAATSLDAGLANGAYAVAFGTRTNADGSLRAQRVQVRAEGATPADRDTGEVEGVISRYASATEFELGGRSVTTNSSTTYANGSATDLKAGAYLLVSGTYDSQQRLVAERIEFRRTAAFRVLAPIETFFTANGEFVAGGVQVRTTARTRWEDRSAFGSRTLRYAELRTGDWVDARGVTESATRTATALVVERRDVPPNFTFELQAVAGTISVANSTVTLAGITVSTTSALYFDRAGARLTAAQFYDQARDDVVLARGRFAGGTFVADSVQLRP
jgi:hypothetical protein